jgi:alpha-tubulin suppressor-like RCC1 family protein
VPNLSNIAAIAAGGNHSLAVAQGGQVFAWGLNNKGQVGVGSSGADQLSPVELAKIDAVIAIEAGFNHSLAITGDGGVLAWGDNEYGQVGIGTTADQLTPVQVAGLQEVGAIAAGFGHSLALKKDGDIFAWGSNNMGQLGDSSLNDRHTPVRVHWPSFEAAPGAIAAGSGMHSLALALNGTAYAWGSNEYGELAHFRHDPYAWIPVLVFDLPPAASLAGGVGHSLALLPDGSLWAWGANYSGQLGDGTTADRSRPVRVLNVRRLIAISGGMHHSLAR